MDIVSHEDTPAKVTFNTNVLREIHKQEINSWGFKRNIFRFFDLGMKIPMPKSLNSIKKQYEEEFIYGMSLELILDKAVQVNVAQDSVIKDVRPAKDRLANEQIGLYSFIVNLMETYNLPESEWDKLDEYYK